jgi:hypothetical protein
MSEPNGRDPDEPQPGEQVPGGPVPGGPEPSRPGSPGRGRPGQRRVGPGAATPGRQDVLVGELRMLGRAVSVPDPPPDLAAAVLSRLAPVPVPRPTPVRRVSGLLGRLPRGGRAVLVVVAALLLAGGAAAPAGATIARWLGIGGVVVVEAPGGPAPPTAAAPGGAADGGAGRLVSLAEAREQVPFAVGVPAGLGDPDRVVLSTDGPPETTVVSMEWLAGGVRLDQFAGRANPVFAKRYYQEVQWLTVAGDDAVWLERPHPVEYTDPSGTPRVETARTSGPSLVWQRGGVTLRLEGVSTPERAVAIADSVS